MPGFLVLVMLLLGAATASGQGWGTGILDSGILDSGVLRPTLVRSVKPTYTPQARAAQIQGWVGLSAIVLSDGKVGEVKVVESCLGRVGAHREPNGDPFRCRRANEIATGVDKLDRSLGLDQQAVNAVKQWVFRPGTKDGKPVVVPIFIRVDFDLRDKPPN